MKKHVPIFEEFNDDKFGNDDISGELIDQSTDLPANDNEQQPVESDEHISHDKLVTLLEDAYCEVAGMFNDYGKDESDYQQEAVNWVSKFLNKKGFGFRRPLDAGHLDTQG